MCHNYIIVRSDLDPAQQVLQGLHAALISRASAPDDALVFLLAPDEAALADIANKHEDELRPYRYHEPKEEGGEDELNAVAFIGVHQDQRRYFRQFKMWKI